jgi:phospholipid transport system substrate-binding protein
MHRIAGARVARLILVGLFALVLLLPCGMRRGVAAQDPRSFVDGLARQAAQVLGPEVPPAIRLVQFRRLFDENFDVDFLGRFALGRYWPLATPSQRQEYMDLFKQYTVEIYTARLSELGTARFQITGSWREEEQIVVASEILPRDAQRMRVEWYLIERGGRYLITDVQVDSISLKVTERDLFASWIAANGGQLDALFAVLRQQIAGP